MEVIPAIDLRHGRVVRLYQGDFKKETVYSQDPVQVAQEWAKAGAPRIHIVDLDGARDGSPANLDAVGRVAASVEVPLQVGGGIRTLDTARNVTGLGVARIVLGTAAVRDSKLVREACQTLGPEAVVVGVDARDGKVVIQGWLESASVAAEELVREMAALGVGRFIYTDVSRDATLKGPNFQAITTLMEEIEKPVIAAGGIGTMEDLERLAALGVEGAIVGVALYTGGIDLREAIERVG